MISRIKSPREANGPDGYPIDNPAFRKAANKVIEDRKDDAEKAKNFLLALYEAVSKRKKHCNCK